MSFRSSAARDGAIITQGPSRLANEIIRPAPAVTVLDFHYTGRHRAVITHDCLLLAHHVGHVKIRDAGQRGWQPWETGTMMSIGPGFGRDLESVGTTGILAVFITAEMVEAVLDCPIGAARIPILKNPTTEFRIIRSLLGALQYDIGSGAPNGPLFTESIAVALIAAASERPVARGIGSHLPDTAVARLPDFIAAHLHEALTLPRIAAEMGVSVRHLTAAFRKAFGQSVHQYVLHQRVKRAVDLLRMGLPIADAVTFSGFADRTSLARALRNVAGLTAREARAGMVGRP